MVNILFGKLAFVTGAGSGIGRAACKYVLRLIKIIKPPFLFSFFLQKYYQLTIEFY